MDGLKTIKGFNLLDETEMNPITGDKSLIDRDDVLDNALKNEFSPFVSWANVHYKNYNIFKYLADIWNNMP